MKIFNPTNSEFVAPVDLNILNNTYNTLETSHKEALKATSALKQTIAQYDLNEDENGWRAGKIAEVQSILNNNTVDGMSAFAVDDLIKASGDILFGADMQGRLKRQAAWKANNEKIDKMNISEDYKRIFKQLNPYGTYQDKVDKNGNIIEGEAWKPTVNPVNTVALSDIMKTALAFAAKEAGSINNVSFLDKDGKPTSDANLSATGEIYQQINGSWQRLSEEKLSAAMEAAIASIPGARESLKQDYDIAKWKYENGEESDIVDAAGKIKTKDEYLASRIDPFYNAATFYNTEQKVTYGDALKTYMQLSRKGLYGTGSSQNTALTSTDVLQSKSSPNVIKNTLPIEAQAQVNNANQIISDFLVSSGVNNENINKMTDDEIKSLLDKSNNPLVKKQVLEALDVRNENQSYIDSILNNIIDEDLKEQVEAYLYITSGNKNADAAKNNPYIKEYNSYKNRIFGDDVAVQQHFVDNDSFDEFVALMGGTDALKDKGIYTGMYNGKHYARIYKDDDRYFYEFTDNANRAYFNTHNAFGEAWDTAKNLISTAWGDNVVRVRADGSINDLSVWNNPEFLIDNKIYSKDNKNLFGKLNPLGLLNNITGHRTNVATAGNVDTTARTFYADINNFMRNLNTNYGDALKNAGNILVGSTKLSHATPDLTETAIKMKSGEGKMSDLKAIYELQEEEAERTILSTDLVQQGAYVIDENGKFVTMSSGDRLAYNNILHNSKPNEIVPVAKQDPNTGLWGIEVTVKGKIDNKGNMTVSPTTIFIPNVKSETFERWNKNTAFKALNDVNLYKGAERPINIVSKYSFNLPDNFTFIPKGNSFDLYQNNELIRTGVPTEEVVSYRDIYYQYKELQKLLYSNSNINKEAAVNMYLHIATAIAGLYGTQDENTITTIFNLITQ